jgi:hypothetical protein
MGGRGLLCALGGAIVAAAVLVPVGLSQIRAERERAEEAERQQVQATEQAREAAASAEREAKRANDAARAAEKEALRSLDLLKVAQLAREFSERQEYGRAVARAHDAWEQSRNKPELAPPPHEP